jgi:outer membrane protein OmpA-like peptidoglycan-associated protein
LDKIKELGIKLAELLSWLGGKIAWLAKKLASGIAAGAKWVGRRIVSAAESIWDWLFGSEPEMTAPVIDLPVTETTEHCAIVAHEDTIVTIGTDLLFPTNEWKLKPEADTLLKEASGRIHSMLSRKDDRVFVEGYTDNVGTAEYNQGLSERRAGAVADWLVQYGGIPMSIIRTQGFGKTQATHNDKEGRGLDRKVQIWVTKHGSTEKVCW